MMVILITELSRHVLRQGTSEPLYAKEYWVPVKCQESLAWHNDEGGGTGELTGDRLSTAQDLANPLQFS